MPVIDLVSSDDDDNGLVRLRTSISQKKSILYGPPPGVEVG